MMRMVNLIWRIVNKTLNLVVKLNLADPYSSKFISFSLVRSIFMCTESYKVHIQMQYTFAIPHMIFSGPH